MTKIKRSRLDEELVARGLAGDRREAAALIIAGKVRVEGKQVDKAGTPIAAGAAITVAGVQPFVSRGGVKLAAALEVFPVEVAGRVCADVGASTGGFTDVLLQRGAARVYAIDVAYGELAWKLRNDPRVIVLERVNASYLEQLPETVGLAVIDVSLQPLRNILPAVVRWLPDHGEIIALVKPQYEVADSQLPPGAVISDPRVHATVLQNLLSAVEPLSLFCHGLIRSPLLGTGGNTEFLAWFKQSQQGAAETGRLLEQALDSK